MSSILSNLKDKLVHTLKESSIESPTKINSENHIGIYPYLFKFKNSIFVRPEYNHRQNLSIYSDMREYVLASIRNELVSKDTHLLYVDGVLSDKFDTADLKFELNKPKPNRSYVIVPKSLDFTKVWWIDKLIGFGRGSGNSFWILGESRLSEVDLKKTPANEYAGYKPMDYPFSIRDIEYTDCFYRNGEELRRCVPHQASGGGHICYGNYQVDVMDALEKKRYDKLIAVLIEFSSRFKYTDGYGRHFVELMERIPRVCNKCGTRNNNTTYHMYGDKTYCNRCFTIGRCHLCGRDVDISNSFKQDDKFYKMHQDCRQMLGNKMTGDFHCEHCENENFKLYYISPTTVKKLCATCYDKYRFEHLVEVHKSNATLSLNEWERKW